MAGKRGRTRQGNKHPKGRGAKRTRQKKGERQEPGMAYSFEGRRMSTLLYLVILLVGIGVHTVAVGGGKVTHTYTH